jgi:folate-dependent phosphoribosylglycinamide formyltransferase PurN
VTLADYAAKVRELANGVQIRYVGAEVDAGQALRAATDAVLKLISAIEDLERRVYLVEHAVRRR